MDTYTIGIVAGAVAVLAFVLYVWDRYSKEQPVEWLDAGKLALSAGGVAGGVAYAVGTEGAVDALDSIKAIAPSMEMFVGKPEF